LGLEVVEETEESSEQVGEGRVESRGKFIGESLLPRFRPGRRNLGRGEANPPESGEPVAGECGGVDIGRKRLGGEEKDSDFDTF
jgi:hypothetical protein